MTSPISFSRRSLWLTVLAIAALVLMTVLGASHQNGTLRSGSTYSHSPDGYGAWYAYVQQRGIVLQRWQKPFSQLIEQSQPLTLLRIENQVERSARDVGFQESQWLREGNRLIHVGTYAPLSEANFSSLLPSSEGLIKIDGRRRKTQVESSLLGDRFGAVIWRQAIGKGEIIWVTTPYLAANAYQDYPQNFQLLANLVSQQNTPIWVDEYLHGYKDAEVIREEVAKNIWHYFLKTPLLILFLQALLLFGFILWSGNRRFGQAIPVIPPVRNNSEVYIRALASVLEKAERVEFVVTHLNQAEQKQLRSQQGLGDRTLPDEALLTFLEDPAPPSTLTLRSLLNPKTLPRNNLELKLWLEKWQSIQNEPKKN